jgi:predicted N-acyltransferase
MLRASVFSSIARVDRDLWNRIGSDPLSRYEVLLALEEAEMPGVCLRYAVLEDARGRAVAGLPFARIDIDGARLTRGLFQTVIRSARAVVPSFLRAPIFLCGTPLSVGNPPVRLAPGVDARPVIRRAAELVEELADEEGVSWRVFKEFPADQFPAARSLEGSWILAPSEPTCVLPLRWKTYREYLEHLRSPYRYKVRKSARRMERSGVQVDRLPLRDGYDAASHVLYENVADRASVQLERLTARFFQGLGLALGDAAQLLRFSRQGRTVGWVAVLVDGDRVYDLFHGIDYRENQGADLYFNQLSETIRFALTERARVLVLGQSTETAKSRFGCRLESRFVAIKHRRGTVQALLRAGSFRLFPAKTPPPPRRVFREARCIQEGAA